MLFSFEPLIDSREALIAWPFSVFYSQTGFWPSYWQISTDLDKILHTSIVVRNTLVDRDRRVGSSRPNQNVCFFVILSFSHDVFIL